MTDYVQIARSELIRQWRIDELMDQLQREKVRSKRYKDLIRDLAELPSFDEKNASTYLPEHDLNGLWALIYRAKEIAAEK